jgi:quinohemoprotein ethanol dehydrogenase
MYRSPKADVPAAATTGTADEIAGERDGRNWLAYGRTYSENHSSPLTQINAENVEPARQ